MRASFRLRSRNEYLWLKLLLVMTPFALFLAPLDFYSSQAKAATCLGKKAQKTSRSFVKIKRNQAVLLTGKKVRVEAMGDSRVCSTTGDITLRFKKGNRNQAALGSGDDRVILGWKANQNRISLGNGNNTLKIKAKANRNIIQGGSGRDLITVANKSNQTSIVAGGGNNVITYAAKANSQDIRAGNGNDTVRILEPARANKRVIRTALGNDRVEIIAKGHTTAYVSSENNPQNLPDTDTYIGGPSNDTVYDYSGGSAENPNRLYGMNGFDKIHSYGNATSNLYGGDGSDWMYSASSGEVGDRLFGERGNDKLFADRGGANAKGAYLDGSEGDDWFYGTAGDDIVIALSGIKKIYTGNGNDKIIKTGNGIGTIEAGAGYDTISYIGHTPPGYWKYSGVMVDLNQGQAMNGKGIDTISGVEHLIGSPFDDLLTGQSGTNNLIDGGIGNDEITSQREDTIDGGLGQNACQGAGEMINCNQSSPGPRNDNQTIVDIGEENILTVLGSKQADEINIGYDILGGYYKVSSQNYMVPSRDCKTGQSRFEVICPATFRELSTLTVDGDAGDDKITVDYTVPEEVTAILNGGEGNNTILGGKTKDFITAKGNGRNTMLGRDGSDQMYLAGWNSIMNGGAGSDTLHVDGTPCQGGTLIGGGGRRDGAVFAGAPRGVYANLSTGVARWNSGACANPVRLRDLDGLEGTKYNDRFVGNKNSRTSFLGRQGIDSFNSVNGVKDTITTGDGGRKNKISKDRIDKVIYGWGLAAY